MTMKGGVRVKGILAIVILISLCLLVMFLYIEGATLKALFRWKFPKIYHALQIIFFIALVFGIAVIFAVPHYCIMMSGGK